MLVVFGLIMVLPLMIHTDCQHLGCTLYPKIYNYLESKGNIWFRIPASMYCCMPMWLSWEQGHHKYRLLFTYRDQCKQPLVSNKPVLDEKLGFSFVWP